MNANQFSTEEMKQFRSFIKAIHPDKNMDKGPKTCEALTWLTAKANKAREKNDWFTVEKMINTMTTGSLDELIAWAHAMMAKEDQRKVDYLAVAREYMQQDSYSRSEMLAWLRRKYGLKGAELAAVLDELFIKPKMEKHGRVDNMALMVELFRLNADKMAKQDLLKMVVEQTGYSLSTVNHFYNAIGFAKEWSKQSS